jgi:hypothetical protein
MSLLCPFLLVAKTSIAIDVTVYLDRHYQIDIRVNFQSTFPFFLSFLFLPDQARKQGGEPETTSK